jgi:hypothetical protein
MLSPSQFDDERYDHYTMDTSVNTEGREVAAIASLISVFTRTFWLYINFLYESATYEGDYNDKKKKIDALVMFGSATVLSI